MIENISLRGLSARTSCTFEAGEIAEVELRSEHAMPVRLNARVRWTMPPEQEGSSHVVGFSIRRVHIVDWFKFMRVMAQIKKEAK